MLFTEAARGEEADEVRGSWSGPGWYGKQYGHEPCGRGCCSNSTLKLVSAGEVRDAWQRRLEELGQDISSLDELSDLARSA